MAILKVPLIISVMTKVLIQMKERCTVNGSIRHTMLFLNRKGLKRSAGP